MDEEIKEVGEMATIEDEEEIAIEEDYTTLEAETIIIDDDSNIQTDAEYEQAVAQKELADGAREALSAVLLSVLEKGEINDDDIAEIAAQQETYIENVTALKILGLTTETGVEKSTTNVITSNIDYDELIKVLSEKADWLYTDEGGQVMINGETVPKIKVTELEAEKIKAEVGEFKELTTENLTATNAEITNLKSEYGEFKNLTAENFTAVNAKIDNLEVTDLTAVNADITNLKAQYAEIQTLVNGNLTSDNIQSIVITGDKFTVANGFIKDAMIETLSANKINTGIINTNNVSIQSEDGSMIINGTTQQFKDKNNKVRIQIGKDATGNFTFALFSQDGKGVLIDETGIKSGAVPDGLIVNDMVADNANISGGKLDISSVISSINNNENTLNSSKIKFDDTNQTLDVAFNQLKSKVETIENITVDGDLSSVIEQVQTNTTNISVMQGQISSLISNTTITKQDGTVTQLKDEFNSVKDTVSSHTQVINSLETNYKKTLKTTTTEYYVSTSNTSQTGGSWSETTPTWSAGKYIWQRMKYTYTDNSVKYSTAVCIQGAKGEQGAKGDKGDQGLQGLQGERGEQGIQGQPGKDGTNGKTTYFHIKYSANANGYPMTETPSEYIGTYVDYIEADSTDYRKYTWARFQGLQGQKGDQGIPGTNGNDGQTYYLHIKYSNDGGRTFTSNNGETPGTYIGVYTDTTQADSTSVSKYTWSKVQGEKGQSLTKSTPQWYASTSKTTQTGGSWVESMPTIDSSHYLWLRYKLDWQNPTATTYTTPTLEQIAENVKEVSAKQVKFQQDLDGFKMTVNSTYATKNEIGKTLKNITNEYYISTSNTNLIGGNWSTTVPTSQANKYIWRREKSEFVDGSTTYGDPICLTNESDEGYTIMLTKDTIVCLWDDSGNL